MSKFGAREIGNGNPCFITFEAGPTHDGIKSAKHLATLAAKSGADAIKFQMLDPDFLVADRALPFTYSVLADRDTEAMEEITEPLYDILCRRVLSENEWRDLKRHCDGLGLTFFSTALKDDEVDLLSDIGCESIKIASGDVNHYPLLKRAARTGMCIQLDTGNSTLGEIEDAVDVIRSEGNENIIIHHCPSGYPARLEGINLNIITTLKQMFPYPIAFSDHTPGWEMDIAAIALGADMIEKTITTDRMIRSVEHIFSLEPQDMKTFITAIRGLEVALGANRRIMHPEEKEKRKAVRRSLYLNSPVQEGDVLTDELIEFRRPGYGISPDRYENLVGARFIKALPTGHLLSMDELKLG